MKAVGALGVSDGRLLPAASYEEAYRAREADAIPYPHDGSAPAVESGNTVSITHHGTREISVCLLPAGEIAR